MIPPLLTRLVDWIDVHLTDIVVVVLAAASTFACLLCAILLGHWLFG